MMNHTQLWKAARQLSGKLAASIGAAIIHDDNLACSQGGAADGVCGSDHRLDISDLAEHGIDTRKLHIAGARCSQDTIQSASKPVAIVHDRRVTKRIEIYSGNIVKYRRR